MNGAEPHSPDVPAALLHRSWQVRWTGWVTSWSDPFGACTPERRSSRVSLVISVELLESDRITMESWLELPGRRQSVLDPCSPPCRCCFDGRLLHIDAQIGEERVLVLSLDVARGRLLYAQTSLVGAAGFGVGAVDPPTVDQVAVGQGMASA